MKKNVIAILLAACMLLALTACAAKAPAADTASDNTAGQTPPRPRLRRTPRKTPKIPVPMTARSTPSVSASLCSTRRSMPRRRASRMR